MAVEHVASVEVSAQTTASDVAADEAATGKTGGGVAVASYEAVG